MIEEVEIIEKTQSLGIVPTAMLNRLKNLDGEGGDFNKQQFLDICNVYLPEAFKRASRQKFDNRKLPDIKREAGFIAMLAMVAAQHMKVDLKKLTTIKKIKEIISQGTGLSAMEMWLEKQKAERETILASSGKQRLIELLLDLRYVSESQDYFDSFERMRNTVAELFEWLKVVAALNRNTTTQPQFQRLLSSISGGAVWNKDRVYFSLIIGIALEKDKILFTINDIVKFCAIVQQDGWRDDIQKRLNSIVVEDLETGLADIATVKNILDDMNVFHNKTVFYYAKKIVMSNFKEQEMLRIADVSLTRGAMVIGRFTGYKPGERSMRDVKKKVSGTLGNQPMAITYQFLLKYPYFIGLLTDKEIFRMTISDQMGSRELLALAHRYGVEKIFNDCITRMNQKVTIAEVVHDIINGKELFGTDITFFMKNKSLNSNKRKPFTEVEQKKIYKTIMAHTTRIFSPLEFSQWLIQVENRDPAITIDLTGVNVSHIAAIYLMEVVNKRPKVIVETINKEPWAQYVDQYGIEYFKQKIDTYNTTK